MQAKCIHVRVNTSMPLQMKLLRVLCIAKMNFVDTEFNFPGNSLNVLLF